ncbi:hypothetical protein PSTG_18431, partial [Puccinia striiformis f. sp. tritici PST-78]
MNPNENSATQINISLNDLMKDAQRIHEYRGDNSYSLGSFLREVDTLLPLFNINPGLKAYIYERTIINKIQGPALDVVRTLGHTSWEDVKVALIAAFGVKESYHQLYQEAFSLKNTN